MYESCFILHYFLYFLSLICINFQLNINVEKHDLLEFERSKHIFHVTVVHAIRVDLINLLIQKIFFLAPKIARQFQQFHICISNINYKTIFQYLR